MLSLLWTGLNIFLLLLIAYAWFRVLRVLRRQIGLGLAVLFMLSLALRGSSSTSDTKARNLLENGRLEHPIGNWGSSASIPLNPNNELCLRFEGVRTDSTLRVHGMYSSISGLMLGHEWKPLAGMANTRKQGVSYEIFLSHEWKLLGIGLYVSSEEYTGMAPLAK
ncbi:hypothetical protein [Hymenobacter yonginensis]|uniref:Uncharacterized protein n=1 Tax=Hymenobacter yonginensis TaxID=748197 RepID=A0ABY7PMZ2_9BACT|nr:hypothetical protein [Hymenobacter yonginensis]WBO83543.1 hypothetical protein O9Z63_14280 [Hymenobacter yonginensis]